LTGSRADDVPAGTWTVGAPIVTYWAGPGYGSAPLTDAAAQQLAEGNWNLAWCRERELDVARRHGLRAQLGDPLLTPAALDDPGKLEALDALIARVRHHPALYSYFLTDEPAAKDFPALGRLIAHLREQDPAHLAYINLFPTYATNQQLGTKGDTVTAYKDYLSQFLEIARPALLSYDHYQFAVGHDMNDYFLNLALVRRAALDARVPFLNIVQACTWTPSMREPGEGEMRYLIYTSLAYGAQGISYYVYSHPGHTPGIASADGQPTAVYHWLKPLNRDFAAIAAQLQPLRSLGVYHAGMMPPGAEPLPADGAFGFDPPIPTQDFRPGERVRGVLLGTFGPPSRGADAPTHVLAVNLDYQAERTVRLGGPAPLDVFDSSAGRWTSAPGVPIELRLPAGGGQLVRVRP
jgi:hypothetical protein